MFAVGGSSVGGRATNIPSGDRILIITKRAGLPVSGVGMYIGDAYPVASRLTRHHIGVHEQKICSPRGLS